MTHRRGRHSHWLDTLSVLIFLVSNAILKTSAYDFSIIFSKRFCWKKRQEWQNWHNSCSWSSRYYSITKFCVAIFYWWILGPLYREETEDFRLNKNDAEYVEAIHTDQDCYGIEDQLGHADFYVNDGDDQPGCMTHVCSHSRSISYFAESLENSQSFKSTRCESEDGAKAFMGGQPGNMDKGITGKFCVETDDDYPFGSGDNKNLDIDDLYALFRWLLFETKRNVFALWKKVIYIKKSIVFNVSFFLA